MGRRIVRLWVFGVLVVVFGGGCTELRLRHDAKVDFAKYKTATLEQVLFTNSSAASSASGLSLRYNWLLDQLTTRADFNRLRAFDEKDAGNSDLFIRIDISSVDISESLGTEEDCSDSANATVRADMTAVDREGRTIYSLLGIEGTEGADSCVQGIDSLVEEVFDESLIEVYDDVIGLFLGNIAI